MYRKLSGWWVAAEVYAPRYQILTCLCDRLIVEVYSISTYRYLATYTVDSTFLTVRLYDRKSKIKYKKLIKLETMCLTS